MWYSHRVAQEGITPTELRGTTVSDEAKTKGKRGKSGPRTPAPVYLFVTVNDESGNAMEVPAERIQVQAVKDPKEVISLLTSGGGRGTLVTYQAPAKAAA
jgi:hypothetical protein